MQLLNHKFGDDGVSLWPLQQQRVVKMMVLDVLDLVQRSSAQISELRSDKTFWSRMAYHTAMDDCRSAMVS